MVNKQKSYQNISCFLYTYQDVYLIFVFLIFLMSFLILYILYPDSNFKEDFMDFEEILPTTNILVETKILKVSWMRHKINPILLYNNQAQKIEDENATKYIYLVNREGDKSHRKLFSEDWFHQSKNELTVFSIFKKNQNHWQFITECKFTKNCIVTMNPNYLEDGGIDLFHALVFKVRNFKHDEVKILV